MIKIWTELISIFAAIGFGLALSQWSPDWAAAGFGMCLWWLVSIGIMVGYALDILEKGRND